MNKKQHNPKYIALKKAMSSAKKVDKPKDNSKMRGKAGMFGPTTTRQYFDDTKSQACLTCKKRETGQLILCDDCEEAFHLTCLKPPLTDVPDQLWHCTSCENESMPSGKKGRRKSQKGRKISESPENKKQKTAKETPKENQKKAVETSLPEKPPSEEETSQKKDSVPSATEIIPVSPINNAIIAPPEEPAALMTCTVCGDVGDSNFLVYCSNCIRHCEHTYCMKILLSELPKDDWFCGKCEEEKEAERAKKRKEKTKRRIIIDDDVEQVESRIPLDKNEAEKETISWGGLGKVLSEGLITKEEPKIHKILGLPFVDTEINPEVQFQGIQEPQILKIVGEKSEDKVEEMVEVSGEGKVEEIVKEDEKTEEMEVGNVEEMPVEKADEKLEGKSDEELEEKLESKLGEKLGENGLELEKRSPENSGQKENSKESIFPYDLNLSAEEYDKAEGSHPVSTSKEAESQKKSVTYLVDLNTLPLSEEETEALLVQLSKNASNHVVVNMSSKGCKEDKDVDVD